MALGKTRKRESESVGFGRKVVEDGFSNVVEDGFF